MGPKTIKKEGREKEFSNGSSLRMELEVEAEKLSNW